MNRIIHSDELSPDMPPDHPVRMAWEAQLRAAGVRPARSWDWTPPPRVRKPGLLAKIRYRLGWRPD